jgi:signal-transduction protein with cAMP-binding, CBS, and nucleotidyltransferase domain
MQSQTRIFTRLVGEFAVPPPVVLQADAKVADLVGRMAEAGQSGALIVDAGGLPVGIVTERDVVRRVALRCTGTEPVSAVMSSPVRTVSTGDFLYSVIAEMRRSGWRHMPVVDAGGRLVGLIERHQALAMAAEQTIGLIERIAHEATEDGMREIKAAQVEVAASLFRDRVPAPEIQQLLTAINRDIHRRVVDLCMAGMEGEGRGAPPLPFAMIVMGSGGRGESYLYPDQDNGFILDNYPDADHTRIDGWFMALAERVTEMLDRIGFPRCRGGVMAINPVWRKTRAQWREQLLGWGRRRGTIAIQLSDIFFDFAPAAGHAEFVHELRRGVTAMLKSSPAFLLEMEHEAMRYGVALGWFGRFVTEKDSPEHRGEINLKIAGTMPLVTNVRLLALKHGVMETSTLERISILHGEGVLGGDEQDYLSGAFDHITGLLLRQQIADFQAGNAVGTHVHPDSLSERERDMLVDSLKAIEHFQERVHHEVTAEVF